MNNEITFWEFISRNRVVIPIVQRDYAQGREDKKNLREKFLKNLKQALDGELPNNENKLKLDFVYGTRVAECLKPLDGQQRLTTLWLLHWFIAYKAGVLDNHCNKDGMKVRERLERFTYETRLSSTEFCRALCRENLASNLDAIKHTAKKSANALRSDELRKLFVSELIQEQTWFYSCWKQDPTICSILRMLSGTPEDSGKSEDIVDGMEEIFIDSTKDDFNKYWEALTSNNSPIVFYQLPMQDYNLTDDLYIKMNARGKQLTGYENFKADLIGYISDRAEEEDKRINASANTQTSTEYSNRWHTLLNAKTGLPISLDNDWINLFWPKTEDTKECTYCPSDDTMFAFFNRFFLVYYLGELGDESNIYYKYLNALTSKKDKEPIRYTALNKYFYDKKSIKLNLLLDLKQILDRFVELNKRKKEPDYCGLNFTFIPKYVADNNQLIIPQFTQIQMVVMAAVIQYFKEGDYNVDSFSRWIRVVRNLVSIKAGDGGDVIRNVSEMDNAVKVFRLLESHNVYQSLAHLDISKAPKSFTDQLTEEKAKAERILNNDGSASTLLATLTDSSGSPEFTDWETAIHAAEDYSFFNGAIRFLFYGSENNIDWRNFAQKFANAKRLFSKSPSSDNALSIKDSNPSLLKALYSRLTVDEFNKIKWGGCRFLFNNSTAAWRYYLLENEIIRPVNDLLLSQADIRKRNDSDNNEEHFIYLLSQTNLLDYTLHPDNKHLRQSWIRLYHYYMALYPSSIGIYLNARNRDRFLAHTPNISVNNEFKIDKSGGCDLLYGQSVNFDYKKVDKIYNFQWTSWDSPDMIYLLESNGSGNYQYNISNLSEDDKYFSFSAHEMNDSDKILYELDKIINKFEASNSISET